MEKLKLAQIACIAFLFCAAVAISAPAQTLTALVSFDGTNGAYPDYPGSLPVQGANGNFYGTTASFGANNEGTLFMMTPAGKLTTLYDFCSQANCLDGAIPTGKLALGTNGNFYGTTSSGGTNYLGTVFEVTPSGKLTTLYRFCTFSGCPDGSGPSAGLVLASDGNFYGTTAQGGAYNDGTVFKITPTGVLTTLASFDWTHGANPDFGALIQASDGNFYGTTDQGGTQGYGTVFKITPDGKLFTLYNFCSQTSCTDGNYPYGGLVQAGNGKFYGATTEGGINGSGTVFEITAAGNLTTLHSFDSSDGAVPEASLIQGSDGNLYGTTPYAGANVGGTAFKITPAGTFTVLYNFCSLASCADGSGPFSGLAQGTNGKLYGTTFIGGLNDVGVIYSLSMGLRPFVETLPIAANIGAGVTILGNNLKSATSVSFNGTPATFKIVSNTEIKASVPTGATTGKVEVGTPTITLRSNVPFRVIP